MSLRTAIVILQFGQIKSYLNMAERKIDNKYVAARCGLDIILLGEGVDKEWM